MSWNLKDFPCKVDFPKVTSCVCFMQKNEAVSVIAAELGVFNWEADGGGNYGVSLEDGSQIRLLTSSGKGLLLEGQLLPEASQAFSKLDKCMDLLKMNFTRAIVESGVLIYVPEYDEIALTQGVPFETENEDFLGELVEEFVKNVKDNRVAIKNLIQPSGSLPSNPFR